MSVENLIIPPRPDILLKVEALSQSEDVSVDAIVELVKGDIGLYAILLSAVNSPWAGLSKPVDSVEQAVVILGLSRVITLLKAVAVRSSFEDSNVLESFWSTSLEVASICADLSKQYSIIDPDTAYMSGMLHNVGVAMMLDNFEGYQDFLKEYGHRNSKAIYFEEKTRFGTDHYLQGAMLAKSWHLGSEVSMVIRCQPASVGIFEGKKEVSPVVLSSLAVLTLAKSISGQYRHYWSMNTSDPDYVYDLSLALNHLHIDEGEFKEFSEDKFEEMMAEEA